MVDRVWWKNIIVIEEVFFVFFIDLCVGFYLFIEDIFYVDYFFGGLSGY